MNNKLMMIITSIFMIISCSTNNKRNIDSPNIVFIIADDASWKHFGVYGSKELKTPNIDNMALQGVLFQNAFVSTPSCTASRGSILTGRNGFELEDGILLGGYLPKKFNTYTEILQKAGYKVGATGKGWGPGTLFGRDVNPAGSPHNYLQENRYKELFCDNSISPTNYAANFNNFLFERKEDQPFVFWVGTHEPHKPFTNGLAATQNIDINKIIVPEFYPDNKDVRTELGEYLAEIQHLDYQVGQVYEVLKKHNQLSNTMVVFTSDNGMPFPRSKSNLYEYGIHMPLIVTWGNQIKKNRKILDLISLTDLAPTFIDAAGLTVPSSMSGKSFLDIIKSERDGEVRNDDRKIFSGIERHGASAIYPSRTIRSKDFQLIWNAFPENIPIAVDGGPIRDELIKSKEKTPFYYKINMDRRPEFELYDVQDDPNSLNNLVKSNNHQIIMQSLKKELFEYLESRDDPRVLGNSDIWEYSPAFILWNGEKGSGVNYSPFTQGQNIPKERMKKMLIEYYHKNDFEQDFIDKVLKRLENNLD